VLDVANTAAEQHALGMLGALAKKLIANLLDTFFPETGPFARDLFPKHMQAIAETCTAKVLSIFGGNRAGKTLLLAYIASVWLTGRYPWWWMGRKFPKPTDGWVATQTSSLMVKGLQKYLIGSDGTGGMIAAEDIVHIDWSPAMGMASRVHIRHQPTGLISTLEFKTYDMGWRRFQTATLDWVILDEEPPAMIFSEALTRTANREGIGILGFTALQGVTPLVAHLWPEIAGGAPEEFMDAEEVVRDMMKRVCIGWKDVPPSVLPIAERARLSASYLPHERQARMDGVPMLGRGLVYPLGQDSFTCEPFEIPAEWPRLCAVDPGGTPGGTGKTAAIWCAFDPYNFIWYAYSEHYQDWAPIPVHVSALSKRGKWIPMLLDPAGRNITDGKAVYAEYVQELQEVNENWPVHKADKRFTVGRVELFGELQSGSLKVFSTLRHTLAEHRQYVINEKSDYVGPHHLWDCLRYIVRGKHHAAVKPSRGASDVPMKEQRFF